MPVILIPAALGLTVRVTEITNRDHHFSIQSAGWSMKLSGKTRFGDIPSIPHAVVKKGTGLVKAIQTSINGVIANGKYTQALTRWNLQNEGIPQSVINPLIQDK